MPALAIAQRLYRDASRADEIMAEAGAPHPAFCPVSFRVLTSGLGANLGAVVPAVTQPDAGTVAIRPGMVSGPYRAPPPLPLPPGAPVGLTIIDEATTRTSVSLTWTAPGTGDPPDNYTVQVGAVDPATGVADSFVSAVTVAAPLTTAIVGGLAPSTVYDFQVYASNENGQGAVSGIVAISTHANAPNAPAGPVASAGTPAETVMVLTWTASAVDASHDAAASYAVYYRPTGTSSFLAATPGWISGDSATVTGLTAGMSYDLEVVASNWGGAAVSGVVTATTFARAPNLPTGLTAGTLLAVTTSSISVSWVASVPPVSDKLPPT